MAGEQEIPISAEAPQGALVHTDYVARTMKAYAIYDVEVDAISRFGTLATVCFSASSFLLSLAAAIWVNAAFVEKLVPEAKILAYVVAPLLTAIAIGGIGLGIWALLT